MNTQHRDHAVVLGAGVAGLLAAKVLAEVYERVTVVDRDELPEHAADRRGVPQGRHAHALLAGGRQALDELLPGLTAELIADGAPAGDVLDDARLHFSGYRLRQAPAGLTVVSASRAFLEYHLRRRVRATDGVAFAPPSDIVGLVATPDARRVTGARVLRRADGSAEEVIAADLVVDATGRGSRTPVWLAGLGYPRPAEERVRVDLGYATCRYRLEPDALGGDLATLHGPDPSRPRGGVLARLEGGEWMLTLFGLLGDYPPVRADEYLAFARSLRFPDIYHTIRDAQPLADPVAFRFHASVRRRYEKLARFPEGLVVLGDGICSFNPVYGQGMSVAAMQALALREHLGRHGTPRSARLRARLGRLVDTPWNMVVAADLALPGVDGRRPRASRVLHAYLTRLHAAAAEDGALGGAFVRVSSLVDPPAALLRPRVVTRVLRRRPPARPQLPAGAAPAEQSG